MTPSLRVFVLSILAAAESLTAYQPASRPLVLDHARIVDGTGAAPHTTGFLEFELQLRHSKEDGVFSSHDTARLMFDG